MRSTLPPVNLDRIHRNPRSGIGSATSSTRSVIAAPVIRRRPSWVLTRTRPISRVRPCKARTRPNITADHRKGIGCWSIDDIVAFLKTGANPDTLASHGMGEEVVHSSSHMTDDDLRAIAVYLLSLKPVAQRSPQPLAATDARMMAGHAIYKDNCAGCHSDAGTGAAGLFPRLAGSPVVQSDDPTTLIHTVLFGAQATATPEAPTGHAMPSFGWRLSDEQAAAVLTFIRNAWGNAAAAALPDQIRTVRAKRGASWRP